MPAILSRPRCVRVSKTFTKSCDHAIICPIMCVINFKRTRHSLCPSNVVKGRFYPGCPFCTWYRVLDGLFWYLAQLITSVRRCVTCNDMWPISLSLFGQTCNKNVKTWYFLSLWRFGTCIKFWFWSVSPGSLGCEQYPILLFQFYSVHDYISERILITFGNNYHCY